MPASQPQPQSVVVRTTVSLLAFVMLLLLPRCTTAFTIRRSFIATRRSASATPRQQPQSSITSSSSSTGPLLSEVPSDRMTATATTSNNNPGRRMISTSSSALSASAPSQASATASKASSSKISTNNNNNDNNQAAAVINLATVTQTELTTLICDMWGHPRYRADQVWGWIRQHGVTDVAKMGNVPKALRTQLSMYTRPSSLTIASELVSAKDGTIKRAYTCHDGQVIESVLMPYHGHTKSSDSSSSLRYTACISSQAGCAQGCVFCATGQMGFGRQLTADEIYEQVYLYIQELRVQEQQQQQDNNNNNNKKKQQPKSSNQSKPRAARLSNIVFMGMGEPLANYRNVREAIRRITSELGIGARKITVSTVGIVPNIRKLAHDPLISKVRLAISLHCATDEERTALLPANKRYGGLEELFDALKEYMETSGQRLTVEWALIQGENDSVETAHNLANLILQKYQLRSDMVHVNVIPLNPTDGFREGKKSNRSRVNNFCAALESRGIACTPRMRRGIDIDAGCGQLSSEITKQQKNAVAAQKKKNEKQQQHDDADAEKNEIARPSKPSRHNTGGKVDGSAVESEPIFELENQDSVVNMDEDDFEDIEFESSNSEAARLLDLVKGSTVNLEELEQKR